MISKDKLIMAEIKLIMYQDIKISYEHDHTNDNIGKARVIATFDEGHL